MALLIVSAGRTAGAGLRTVGARSLAAGLGVAALALVALGVALGQRLGDSQAGGAAALLDASRPDGRALIEHVGTLSGRLLRLESEAERLGRSIGTDAGEAATDAAEDGAPSGGPWVAPVLPARGGDVVAALERFAAELDRVEAVMERIARAAALRDLDGMALPSRFPITGGRISSGFGNRTDPFTGDRARHTGVDFPAPRGAPILASAGGRVRFAGFRGAYGNTVEIDHGNGLVTRYGHASRLFVRRGDLVLPGQKIAAVGSTGRSTGPHLHFEVLRGGRAVEPRLYLAGRR
jgi:murein DD-endopeptidase MepM/ murein hydrolase activator NlpD